MKKIYLTVGIMLACASPALAGKTVTIPAEDYRAILQRLDALQKRGEELERRQPAPALTERKIRQDIDEIYDTLDQVETKALQDRINLGAELRTRVDNFKAKDRLFFSNGQVQTQESNDNSWSNRFRLNLSANIRKNLKFTGRFTVYKNFADSDVPATGISSDANRAHIPDDTTLKLDRAYVDWIPEGLPVPLAITFGRHPSSEGPPLEYKENRKRQSTYPGLLFDGEADGIVATVGLERYLGWPNAGIRLAWGKAYQDDDDVSPFLDNPGGIDDTNVYALFFETTVPGIDNSLLVLSALRAENLAADFTKANIGFATAANIGDMDLYGIHFQADNVGDSGFDLFFSAGLNRSHPNGQTIADPTGNLYGLLNNDGVSSHTGWAVYTGLRYTIASARFNNPKIGVEYNHGSDYWFSFTQGSTELYNKLAVRGDVFDFYYIQPFNRNLYARIGYTYVDYGAPLSGFHIGDLTGMGAATGTLSNAYLLLDCRF